MNRLRNPFLGVTLSVMFICYFLSISTSGHIHIEDGIIVRHSHPYSNASHGHTQSEYSTITFLTQVNITDPIDNVPVLLPDLIYIEEVSTPLHFVDIESLQILALGLRAPPVQLFS